MHIGRLGLTLRRSPLLTARCCSFAEGERFAKANDLLFLEASAKTGDYVEETMVTAAINVLERINNGQFRMDDEVPSAVRSAPASCMHVFTVSFPFPSALADQTHGIRVGVKAPQKGASGCC